MSDAARDRESASFDALVMGWHGSTKRHLRPFERTWRGLGGAPVSSVPDTFRALAFPSGWQSRARALADTWESSERGAPWIAHAFSNAGFWSLAALLDELASRRSPRLDSLRGVLVDSAPGFPEKIPVHFTARFATRALLPPLLHSLGVRSRAARWLLAPPTAAFLAFWHVITPAQVRFMETSQARLLAALPPDAPLTLLHGSRDRLVRPTYVREFAARAIAEGRRVERHEIAAADHVRVFLEARGEYERAMEALALRATGAR